MAYVYPKTKSPKKDDAILVTQSLTAHEPISEVQTEVTEVKNNNEKIPLTRGMVMYTRVSKVPMYKNPTIEFDAKITEIPFGAMVIVGEPKGRFYPVNWKDYSGWVLKDDMAESGKQTHPAFADGESNEVDSNNTALVRALIKDEFGLSRSEFPLQAGEYVLYRLWRRGLEIHWPDIRPRTPGTWHTILKGKPGVYIGISPEVGSIMECVLEGEIGHVAYVEAVFPDESITITEVNNPDSGLYRERQLTKEEWKELRPVFIEIQ